jgi:hypothetical protein
MRTAGMRARLLAGGKQREYTAGLAAEATCIAAVEARTVAPQV